MSYDSHGSFRLLVWASPFSALGMSVSVCLWQDTLKTPLQPVSSCLMVNLNLNVWLIIRPNPLQWQPDSCSSKINIISMESDNINSSWVLRSCWTAVCSGHSHCLSPSVFQPHTIYTLPFCLIESFLKKNLYLEVRVWLNHTSLFHFFFFTFFSKSKLQKMKVRHIWQNIGLISIVTGNKIYHKNAKLHWSGVLNLCTCPPADLCILNY